MTPAEKRKLIERLAKLLWDLDREDFRSGGTQPGHSTWQDTGEACEWEHQNRPLKNFQRKLARRILGELKLI